MHRSYSTPIKVVPADGPPPKFIDYTSHIVESGHWARVRLLLNAAAEGSLYLATAMCFIRGAQNAPPPARELGAGGREGGTGDLWQSRACERARDLPLARDRAVVPG